MNRILRRDGSLIVEHETQSIKTLAQENSANLTGANLRGAYLEGANLEGANLEGAYLEGANNLIHLQIHDPRCYRGFAVKHGEIWRVFAGCHNFTLAEANDHWGSKYKDAREIGDYYLRALDYLPEQIARHEARMNNEAIEK